MNDALTIKLILLLQSSIGKIGKARGVGGSQKTSKWSVLEFLNHNFKAHQEIYLNDSIKKIFKCSKINKLINLFFPFCGFCAAAPPPPHPFPVSPLTYSTKNKYPKMYAVNQSYPPSTKVAPQNNITGLLIQNSGILALVNIKTLNFYLQPIVSFTALYGKSVSIHFLIGILKPLRELICLISEGAIYNIFLT